MKKPDRLPDTEILHDVGLTAQIRRTRPTAGPVEVDHDLVIGPRDLTGPGQVIVLNIVKRALQVVVHGALILGRDPDPQGKQAAMVLEELGAYQMGVSRQHAVLEANNGAVSIKDLRSTNGTYVNGKRLIPHQPAALHDGAEIRLGNLRIWINFSSQTKTPSPTAGDGAK